MRKDALLDIGTDMSHRGSVETLAEVIGSVMIEHGHNQRTFGELIGESPQTVGYWVRAERVPSLDDIYSIEEKLELWHGTILRRAGYVDDPQNVREAIDADPRLDRAGRDTVRIVYDGLAK